MDDFKKALENLEKIVSAKDENEMFQMFAAEQENFNAVQKEWFQSSIEKESVEAEHEDYLHEIIRYVNLLILMYQKAIPHKCTEPEKLDNRQKGSLCRIITTQGVLLCRNENTHT